MEQPDRSYNMHIIVLHFWQLNRNFKFFIFLFYIFHGIYVLFPFFFLYLTPHLEFHEKVYMANLTSFQGDFQISVTNKSSNLILL